MQITGRIKKLHVVKLHKMWAYFSLSTLRIITSIFIRCVPHSLSWGNKKRVCNFVAKYSEKKPFVRNLIRWIYHIKIDLLEIMLETGTSMVDSREKLCYWQRLHMNKAGRVN